MIYTLICLSKNKSQINKTKAYENISAKDRCSGLEVAVKFLKCGTYNQVDCGGCLFPEELELHCKARFKDYPGLFH